MSDLRPTFGKAANRSNLLGLALFLLMLFLLTAEFNIYLTETLIPTVYYSAISVIFCFGVYFRVGRLCTEEKLMLLFVLWLAVTRIFHGFSCFFEEYFYLFNFCLPAAILCVLLTMEKKKRIMLFKALCLAGVIYYTVLAVLSFYAAIGKRTICNPVTLKNLISWFEGRLCLFELHPNTAGQYFMGGMLYSLVLAVSSKNKLLKLLFAFTALINYFAVSLTGCRTVMVAIAFTAAFTAVILIYFKMLRAKKLQRIAVCAAVLVVLMPVVYEGFELSGLIFTGLNSSAVSEINTPAVYEMQTNVMTYTGENTKAEPMSQEEADGGFAGTRSEQSYSGDPLNGRLVIYESVPMLLKKEPIRLLIGSRYDDRMTFTNQHTLEILNLSHVNLHNSYLEILVFCGLPGLLLVLAFTVLTVCKALCCSLSENEQLGPEVRILAAPVLAFCLCSLPESFLFFATDFQAMMFFVTVAVFLGSYEK